MKIRVIGARLAGCEAAWQIAQAGVQVELWEMKPQKYSPAHHSPDFAELICSNSLKAARVDSAAGLLKGGNAPPRFPADAVRGSMPVSRRAGRSRWTGDAFSAAGDQGDSGASPDRSAQRGGVRRSLRTASTLSRPGPLTSDATGGEDRRPLRRRV